MLHDGRRTMDHARPAARCAFHEKHVPRAIVAHEPCVLSASSSTKQGYEPSWSRRCSATTSSFSGPLPGSRCPIPSRPGSTQRWTLPDDVLR
jgi:hypothetical protein